MSGAVADAITPDAVRDALRAMRSGGRREWALTEGPLAQLDRLTLRLRAGERPDTPQGRAEELRHHLAELIWAQIVDLHPGRSIADRDLALGHELGLLAEDFSRGDPDLQAWSWLWYRYLADEPVSVGTVANHLGFTERTLQRRLDDGLAALARRLKADQAIAAREADRHAGAPARERVRVVPAAPERTLPEAMAELLEAVRHEEAVVRLTPEQATEIARRPASDLTTYRLGRIAEWSQPRYRLDARFVQLALLVDQGEAAASDRWMETEERYTDLAAVLSAVPDPALVLLGPPGAGKSTLLRRFELDRAIDALRGSRDGGAVTFFVPLSHYYPPAPDAPLPSPLTWLGERWSSRYPKLPPLAVLLDEGRLTLLLDALNEMPSTGAADYRARLTLWRQFLQDVVAVRPGNRVILSCRSLDYSAPLSRPSLRVPQAEIQPLSDDQIRRFLALHVPGWGEAIWRALAGMPELALVRVPYFLKLLVDQAAAATDLPHDRAALFTGFVRRALAREVERGNALFQPDTLLTERDCLRVARGRSWRTPHDLPEQGRLIRSLAGLAYGMQAREARAEAAQVRLGYGEALALVAGDRPEDILRAGAALGVLEEDAGRDEVLFAHQLLQEYFAARRLAGAPAFELARAEWRAAAVQPNAADLIAGLPPGEALPPLPQTGWEETAALAAAMSPHPEAFVRGIMAENLVLAARCAAQPAVGARLPDETTGALRSALVGRSRDPAADLRARVEAGLALGRLGDPRFERHEGPHGAFLLPPVVELPGARYVIGEDEPFALPGLGNVAGHTPRHEVDLAPFAIGRFAVTNAEWHCFVRAGGYDDERWWRTAAARAWRRGEGTAEGRRQAMRRSWDHWRGHPESLEAALRSGAIDEALHERWRWWLAMDATAFEASLRAEVPDERFTEPRHWHDERFNNGAQPVVGIGWYEACAYAAWLSAQSGLGFRLPSEAEWEAAARGRAGRRFGWGDDFTPWRANTAETRLKRPSPVGVMVDGDTPEGLCDMGGNVWQWTRSLWGPADDRPGWPYPYRPDDGRESPEAGPEARRVLRGGSWTRGHVFARAAFRFGHAPEVRDWSFGLRLALTVPPAIGHRADLGTVALTEVVAVSPRPARRSR